MNSYLLILYHKKKAFIINKIKNNLNSYSILETFSTQLNKKIIKIIKKKWQLPKINKKHLVFTNNLLMKQLSYWKTKKKPS